ncbi:MAG: aldehyde ferredoxin oxidoreductase family protein [Thermodesulfobacteriota bacterium]|nr:aldehyde ferredoxin oxidoreductase family protein [Thermodesulfobacteriota bacterium]
MFGRMGTMVYIDLTERRVKKEPLPNYLYEDYLGGAGVNARLLYENIPPEMDSLDPSAVVILGVGPLVGTIVPSSGRIEITAKSPVTGIFGDSNAGGDFGPELKFAGYDHLVIRGKAKEPVYLWIDNDQIEIRDARPLWGKSTWEADELLKKIHGDRELKTALIGPAAENGILYGTVIINRYRACGKTGMGTVFASKNLKGIAVTGSKDVKINDPEASEEIVEKMMKAIKSHPGFERFAAYGTMLIQHSYQAHGKLPVKNRQEIGLPEDLFARLSTQAFDKVKVRDLACFNCPVHCSSWHEVTEGRYQGQKGEKPEFVAVAAFGTNLGNYDMNSVCFFQNLSNQYGIDMMEFGNTLGLAMEAYQRGLLKKEETDGIALEWGDQDAIETMFFKTVRSEGSGKVLGEGVHRLTKRLGKEAEGFTTDVKGYGHSWGDCRSSLLWGLAYGTASRGGDHLKSFPAIDESGRKDLALQLFGTELAANPQSEEAKGKANAWFENYSAVLDSLGLCKFAFTWIGLMAADSKFPDLIAEALTAATGTPYDGKRLLQCGERIYNVEKAFNVRCGLKRKDDYLPLRMLDTPAPAGPRKGEILRPIYEKMLNEYYEARGWDQETSIPTSQKLKELGLEDVDQDLAPLRKPGKA